MHWPWSHTGSITFLWVYVWVWCLLYPTENVNHNLCAGELWPGLQHCWWNRQSPHSWWSRNFHHEDHPRRCSGHGREAWVSSSYPHIIFSFYSLHTPFLRPLFPLTSLLSSWTLSTNVCPARQCCVGGRASTALCLQALCVSSKLWFTGKEPKTETCKKNVIWSAFLCTLKISDYTGNDSFLSCLVHKTSVWNWR